MSTLRSASYALGVLAFAGICTICAVGVKSALAAGPRLLYVSDPTVNAITVFSLPDLAIKGTITGLNQPRGLCSDDSGNIWVTDFATQQILEYAHGGTSPITTLTDANGFPFACDVERHHHHDLAVANLSNAPSGPGETEVYPGGMAAPLPSYDLTALQKVRGEAYDHHGNLFMDGQTNTGTFVLAELPVGSTAIHQITLTGGTYISRACSNGMRTVITSPSAIGVAILRELHAFTTFQFPAQPERSPAKQNSKPTTAT
ncbi:MAG TPA: hypothetical protein VFE16_07065 [Candidatus Cybelea sp.]|jgi:hypothetical protein|nr:hypothetical protein [Candidatus Cybelea sp.]